MARGFPEVSKPTVGQLSFRTWIVVRVREMETVPRLGGGVPPKKDKPQAKRKVKDLDEKEGFSLGSGCGVSDGF